MLRLAAAFVLGSYLPAFATVINLTVNTSGILYHGVGVANKDDYGYGNNNPESNLAFLNTEIANYNAFYNPDMPVAVGPVGASFDLSGNSYSSIGGYDYVVFHYGAGQAQFGSTPAWVPEVVVPPVYHPAVLNPKGKVIKAAYTVPGYTIPGHFTEVEWEKSQGGWWAAFYIGGASGITFNVPTPGPSYEDYVYNGLPVGGFSSARYFNVHREPPPPSVPDAGSSTALVGLGLLTLAYFRRKIA